MGLLTSILHKKKRGNRYSHETPSRHTLVGERLGLSQNRGRSNTRLERKTGSSRKLEKKREKKKEVEQTWIRSEPTSPSAPKSSFGVFKSVFLWLMGLSLGVVALLGLVLGGLQLYRLATTSDFFAIRRIEIRGIVHFKRDAVLEVAGIHEGTNSLTVSIAEIESRVRQNPWVADVAVTRRLPDSFEIRIKERAPVFWMRKEGTLYYVDKKGDLIAPVNAGNFLSLPTLEILSGGEVLLPQLDQLIRAFQAAKLPVNMSGVSLFRLSAAKGFEVFVENRNLVLCIAPEDWDINLRRLGEALLDLARRNELKIAKEVWADNGNVWVVAGN